MANTPVQTAVLDSLRQRATGSATPPVIAGAPAVWSSAKLVEFDFAGIEQVLMGWCLRDPAYIRIAKLGTHAIVASHVLAAEKGSTWQPADLSWPDTELGAYLKSIKQSKDAHTYLIYDQSKRCVHGCVPGDHEVLTPDGWVRLDALADGTPVAQWDHGAITFVVPSQVTRSAHQDPEPLTVLDGRAVQIQMTAGHRVPLMRRSHVVETAASVLPTYGRIPVTGVYTAGTRPWSGKLALLVAGQADGQLRGRQWTFHLCKPRKIERLHALLGRAQVRYTEHPCGCHPTGRRIRFTLDHEGWLHEKRFVLAQWLTLNAHARRCFLEEVTRWDGTRSKHGQRTYLTTEKQNAVTVQTIAHLNGCQGLLRGRRRCGFSGRTLYTVTLNRRKYARLECLTRTTAPKPPRVYCVTVPSSYFLVRYRDTISVTGNTAYGLTIYGMCRNFPETFPTLQAAGRVQRVYFDLAPGVPAFHTAVRDTAHAQHYLGGAAPYTYDPPTRRVLGHPYQYQHWFWSVVAYEPLTLSQKLWREKRREPVLEIGGKWYGVKLGEDAKRVVAYYPQSIGRGVLTAQSRPLFDPEHALAADCYIGDLYYGQTPLRAPIHDSLLLEVPTRMVDRCLERGALALQRPVEALACPEAWGIGSHLTIGVDGKIGEDWGTMHPVTLPGLAELGVASDVPYTPAEDEDEDDVLDLETEMGRRIGRVA